MPRQGWLAVGICLTLASILFYAGCQKKDDPDPGSGKSEQTKDEKAKAPGPIFGEGWETDPEFVFVFSGQQKGYMEPCGCSETQSGGLARRADLIKKIEAKKWDYLALDLGGSVNPERATRQQTRLKFQAIIKGMQTIGFKSMGIGPEEIRMDLGEPFFLATQKPQPDSPFRYLSANVQFYPQAGPDLNPTLPMRVFTVAGKKVAVTSILGTEFWQDLFPQGSSADIKFTEPEAALQTVLPEMEKEKPDVMVLLSHAPLSESKALAAKFPQFQIVLSAGYEEPAPPETVGNTQVITLGYKGKHLCAVGYYPNRKQPFQVNVIELDNERFENAPNMNTVMADYQEELKNLGIVRSSGPISHPRSGATFVGAAKCGECHTKAYKKWSESKHAHAFESLEKGRKGQEENWVSRIHDAECLACHVTGWSPKQALYYKTGYTSEQETPWLKGQQCENCHGPGSKHVEVESTLKDRPMDEDLAFMLRAEMKIAKMEAEKKVCIKCHDAENSPAFNFDEYWPKIAHPWRD